MVKQSPFGAEWDAFEKSRRAQTRAINQVAREHALTTREKRELRIYFNEGQTAAEFDALSVPLQAAADAVSKLLEASKKSYYVMGRVASTGELIRCDDSDTAEHELGLMRSSKCNRIARTTRLATETEALRWFPVGVTVTKRDSRFNARLN